MPKIDLTRVPLRRGSSYPAPLDKVVAGRAVQALGDAGGLTQFGANLVHLPPGALSSLRHWHEEQDEFLMVVTGSLTLVEDDAQTRLAPGDCAAFPRGAANGHHLVNHGDGDASFLVIGTRTATETGWYSDHDLKVTGMDGTLHFTRRDGSPWTNEETP